MKKKALLCVATAGVAAISALSVVLLNNENTFLRLNSSTEYTCGLPTSFSEIDDVIGECIQAGNVKTANTLSFRGTVTRRDDNNDVVYVQRVNQVDNVTYGLRVAGITEYANTLEPGNVVDFSGGLVYMYQGVPTFELTSSSDAQVAFSQNTNGYGPITYQSVDEALQNFANTSHYDEYNLLESYAYSSNRLITVNNVVPTQSNYSWDGDEESRIIFDVFDIKRTNSMMMFVDSAFGLDYLISDAYEENLSLSVTGYMQIMNKVYNERTYQFFYFNIVNYTDVVKRGSYLDLNTITSVRNAELKGSGFSSSFAIYTIEGHGDVPYVEITDFHNNGSIEGIQGTFKLNKYDYSYEDHYYLYYNENYSYFQYFVNPEIDYFGVDYDPNHFALVESWTLNNDYYGNYWEVLANGGYNSSHVQADLANSVKYGGDGHVWGFILASYGLDIVEDANHVIYLPLQVANLIFNETRGYGACYNGKDLYYNDNLDNNFFTQDEFSPWLDPSFDKEMSPEYAEYNYQCLCLALEEVYGLWDIRKEKDTTIGYDSADSLLNALGYKERLLTTNALDFEKAFAEFVGEWLYDGHASYNHISPLNDDSYYEIADCYRNKLVTNERYVSLFDNSHTPNSQRRSDAGLTVGLTFEGDTAIIRFDSFVTYNPTANANIPISEYANFYLDDFSYEELHDISSELFFRKAFNEIDSHKGINNVVIDLSLNGGGANNALIVLEAYLTSDPVHTSYNRYSGITNEIHYNIDINYDGVFDSSDTYEGVYNFYLMTSSSSFSCGNYFPTVIKDKGAATLIGQRSGGGACCVGLFSTAYGILLNNSSCHQLGVWDNVNGCFRHNDDGIEVDYVFDPTNFYNDAAIANFINSL